MIELTKYIEHFARLFPHVQNETPWFITGKIQDLIIEKILGLNSDYVVRENVAIHRSAVVEEHVIIKGPAIISAACFIGAHAYIRGGVFLDEKVSIGPGCEVKSSLIFSGSALAHFNFVGDSIVGSDVNMEAGAVIANHFNERQDKTIAVLVDGKRVITNVSKFGALVGDHTRIGANAVLTPGTILNAHTVIKRLQLVDQVNS
jgi:bifunctional UDP-N-acetylglucosamine pyrophosphorylase / glucosamine-1-phosphate N-acetyltransferase